MPYLLIIGLRRFLSLLNSIDCFSDDISVLVCEDFSPKRFEIRDIVLSFSQSSELNVSYFENERNLGYDANLRNLLHKSNGIYTMFMGDDDLFIPGELANFLLSFHLIMIASIFLGPTKVLLIAINP